MNLTPEQIAEIATKAALAAVVAATGGAQAPSAEEPEESEDARDKAVIAKDKEEAEFKRRRASELVAELLPLIMAERHMVVFRWMTEGMEHATAVQQIIRAEVSRRMPDYREAMGGGGNSSRNAELLSDRLPRRD